MKRISDWLCAKRRHPIRDVPGPVKSCACGIITFATWDGYDLDHALDCIRADMRAKGIKQAAIDQLVEAITERATQDDA